MDTTKTCSSCGKALASNAPAGLCPECLMQAGFPTGTEPQPPGTKHFHFRPPTLDELKPHFPQLEILTFIGQGGMGAVYKARQPMLDRYVALKILPPEAATGPGFTERFTREARALARLNHPNIVAVHEFGTTSPQVVRDAPRAPGDEGVQGYHYLIMEFVDGANLREMERAQRLSPAQALSIVPKICEALQYAHDEGVVHRDIKPENILVDKKGRVKIADFGIAKILGAEQPHAPLTGVVGTPHYMAPEQVEKPQTVDHRADIYSLGVVFYEMLTGELPLGRFAAPSKKVQIDVRLDEVVLRALEKEPEQRYQQASELKTRIETVSSAPPSQKISEPAKRADSEIVFPVRYVVRIIQFLAAVVVISGLVYGFVLVPFHPDNAAGKTVFVYQLARSYRAGDVVVYRWLATGFPAKYLIGRVAERPHGNQIAIERRFQAPQKIPISAVVGKVISNTGAPAVSVASLETFGPIIERTLNDLASKTNCALNLITGELLTPPDNILEDLNPRRVYKPKEYQQKLTEVQNWCRENDAHLLGPRGNVPHLNATPGLTAFAPEQWNMSVEDLTNCFADMATLPAGSKFNIRVPWPVETRLDNSGTYAFKTYYGALGLLKIISTNKWPNLSITIQYKLLQSEASMTAADANVSNAVSNAVLLARAEVWSPSPIPTNGIGLQSVLDNARKLAEVGEYEKSLQHYIWYYNHALDIDSGQTGVRLSFALSAWMELGEKYPKALQALAEIRDDTAEKMLSGRGDFRTFMELHSLNSYLKKDEQTYSVFKTIEQRNPALAKQCYIVIEDMLANKGEYQTCKIYMGDPQAKYEQIRQGYDMQLASAKRFTAMQERIQRQVAAMSTNGSSSLRSIPDRAIRPPDTSFMQHSAEQRFVDQVCRLIEVLIATGSPAQADDVLRLAKEVVTAPRFDTATADAQKRIAAHRQGESPK